ncbi:MAG: hypothetical protein ACK4NX_03900, partial [Candidatus Paceibacteria bacterium]
LKEEFLNLGNFHPDPKVFNQRLMGWLEEFIFKRPHKALGYKTPIEVACGKPELSKMYLIFFILHLIYYPKNYKININREINHFQCFKSN